MSFLLEGRPLERPPRTLRWVAVAVVAASLGCAASRAAVPDVEGAEDAIREAEANGANDDMSASLYLAVARSELEKSVTRLGHGDREAAARWAIRAQTDANLATLLAHEATTHAAALRTFEHARSLSQELESQELERSSGAPRDQDKGAR